MTGEHMTHSVEYARMVALPGRSAADVVKETAHRDVKTVGTFWALDDDEHDVHFRAAHDLVDSASVPRHRHTFEQVYFHIAGQQTMGGRTRPPGTFAYHPESVHYGPVSNDGSGEQLEMIVCQFPGPSGGLFGSNEDVGRAMKAMREQGASVERGLVVWPDGRKQDSTEAAFEYLMGDSLAYAPPVYDEPLVVHAPSIAWRPSAPGVSVKRLGAFGDRGPIASIIRLDPGASTTAGTTDWAEMRFVYQGTVTVDGQHHERVSAWYCPPGTEAAAMTATDEGADILVIQVQRGRLATGVGATLPKLPA